MIGRTGRDPRTRELVLSGTGYIVAYRIRAEQVEILAVIHRSRRWPDKL
jgi:toxin ParE1/3/4